MKTIILILVIFSYSIAGAQNSRGDLALESAANAMKEERYKDAIKKYTEAENYYINNTDKIPGIQRQKILAQDKLYSVSKKDTILQYDILIHSEAFLDRYEDSKNVSKEQFKEVYLIWEKNEMPTAQMENIRKTLEKAKSDNTGESTDPGDNDATTDADEEDEEDDKFKKQKQELAKFKKGSNQDIGTFTLKKRAVKPHNLSFKVCIDSLDMEIKDGFIRNLRLFSTHADSILIFSSRRPISLIKYDEYRNVKLHLTTDKTQSVNVGDVLEYVTVNGNNFTPDNINLTIRYVEKLKDRQHVIKTNEGLSNYIDYRIYSDFLGLIDEASNGIVNFEASACIPVMPSNIREQNIYFIKCLKPHFRYSRFDNDDRAIPVIITEDATAGIIKNKLDILQNSFISGGFTFDIFTVDPHKTVFEMNIPFKVNFNLTEAVFDDLKENVTSTTYGSGLELKFSRTNNFGMTLYGYLLEVRHHYNENRQIQQIKPFTIYNTGAELFFYNKQEQSNSAVFLRFNFISQTTSSNNFFQMQIGYKSTLDL